MSEEKEPKGSRVLQTVCVSWALGVVGISDLLLGTSLTDLQALLQTDLYSLNFIVLAIGLCELVGDILTGFLAKTVDVHLRLCVSVILLAVTIGVTAVVANYYYILVAFSLQGLFKGIVYCYAIEKASDIWPNEGVSYQLTSLGTTIGGLIAPFFAGLFLCTPTEKSNDNVLVSNSSIFTSTTVNSPNTIVSYSPNETSIDTTMPTLSCSPQDVRIKYAYIFLGIISLPPVVAFFTYWRRSKKNAYNYHLIMESDNPPKVGPRGKSEKLFSCLFVISFFPLVGGKFTYFTFLTEFGIKGSLRLEKSKMVFMTSAFSGFYLVGQIFNMIITPWLGVGKIITFNIIPLLICGIVLIPIVSWSEIILWALTCEVGIFLSPLVAAGYAWYGYHVKLDHKIIAASSVSFGVGAMIVPYIGGLLFEAIGPVSFLYFCYANFVFVAIVFFLMFILDKQIKQHNNLTTEFISS